jgi:uncharacterized DUF497 family protein
MIVFWDPLPGGNVEHIAEHDLTIEDVEHVLTNPDSEDFSHATSRPCVFGYVPDGRFIIVIYEEIDEDTITPFTAYEVPEPG